MPKRTLALTMTYRQQAAILASLRILQHTVAKMGYDLLPADWLAIANNCGAFKPLSIEEIDDLCEHINLDCTEQPAGDAHA
ncbi:MAG: hypothetical protein ACKOC5_10290 [Chloroflexota bacterium]